MTPDELQERLTVFLQRMSGGRLSRIQDLRLLTGGASRQTWSFDALIKDADGDVVTEPLILRADPRTTPGLATGETEFGLLAAAGEAGVPVPKVHFMGDDSLGMPFLIMERVDGETIPRRLLRDEQYAPARASMTEQLGAILAKLHQTPVDDLRLQALSRPPSGISPAEHELARYEQIYRAVTPDPHPAFELAFRRLHQEAKAFEPCPPTLIHGDYRIGNVIFGPEGARAILDWELAHVGDPAEDLGWISVRSWRFGNDDLPVGGLGSREAFWQAYEEAGGEAVDPERVRFWETFGNLRWGVSCIIQAKGYLDGRSKSVELASIGRRVAETEWELLELMGEA